MSPAPRIRAERPASRLKILPARATAAEGAVAVRVPELARAATLDQPLGEEGPHYLGHRVARFGEIELRAVAGREQHAAARARGEDAPKRPRHLAGGVREPLAHLERRRAMV